MIIHSRLLHKLINYRPIKHFLTTNRFCVRGYFNYLYMSTDPYGLNGQNEIKKFNQVFRLVERLKCYRAVEIGCGEGRLSYRVAPIADQVFSFDISDNAIHRAKKLNSSLKNIQFQRRDLVTEDFSGESYDFIFCSEILVYIEREQLASIVAKIINLLTPSGKLLLVHTRSLKDDTSGTELKEFGAKTIHEAFIRSPQLELETEFLEEQYRASLMHKVERNARPL